MEMRPYTPSLSHSDKPLEIASIIQARGKKKKKKKKKKQSSPASGLQEKDSSWSSSLSPPLSPRLHRRACWLVYACGDEHALRALRARLSRPRGWNIDENAEKYFMKMP